jgi:two-component system sensor histidine kinase MprB
MSLRLKLVLALVLLTAAATITIGALSYAGIAHRLEGEVDRSLDDAAREIASPDQRDRYDSFPGDRHQGEPEAEVDERPPSFEQILVQRLDAAGTVVTAPAGLDIPVGVGDRAVASGQQPESRRDVTVDGTPYRVLTAWLGPTGGAVQVARSLSETNRLLDSLRALTVAVTIAVTGAAAAIGWLIARQVTRRITLLTSAAERVAETGTLDIDVPVTGRDEAGRLSTAFTKMLGALSASRNAQQRLVQDAGHELRTPLTSLRTNISVLRIHDDLPPETKTRVLDQLDDEAHELSDLVNELVELATDRRDEEPEREVALRELVEQAAERARRRTGRSITVTADDSRVHGRAGALDRAVANLIDNAIKFDAATDDVIAVSVRAGQIEVCDQGPGIDSADLEHVFDRFFRSVSARSRPGSGLGLSIVRDVAESHGGSAFARNRPDGGACVGFSLPRVGTA